MADAMNTDAVGAEHSKQQRKRTAKPTEVMFLTVGGLKAVKPLNFVR